MVNGWLTSKTNKNRFDNLLVDLSLFELRWSTSLDHIETHQHVFIGQTR